MGINDVSRAFKRWEEALTGTRTDGSYDTGNWVAGTATILSFRGVVQNTSPDDLLVLEEGNRADDSIKIHTIFKLMPMKKGTTTSDIVSYDGNQWLVHNVAYRYIGNYNKAIAVRL